MLFSTVFLVVQGVFAPNLVSTTANAIFYPFGFLKLMCSRILLGTNMAGPSNIFLIVVAARGTRTVEAYVCAFVCAATEVIHVALCLHFLS